MAFAGRAGDDAVVVGGEVEGLGGVPEREHGGGGSEEGAVGMMGWLVWC